MLQCFLLSLNSLKVPGNFVQRNPSQLGRFVRNVKGDLDELGLIQRELREDRGDKKVPGGQ